jgi:predicted amidohydrolase YtcJ
MLLSHAGLLMVNLRMGLMDGIYHYAYYNFHLIRKLNRFPEQRLTRQEALRGNLNLSSYRFLESFMYLFPGMTIDPAYASFTETTLGSLEPGKLADFTVLSQNIMTIAGDKILATMVDATVIDGKPVYGTI